MNQLLYIFNVFAFLANHIFNYSGTPLLWTPLGQLELS